MTSDQIQLPVSSEESIPSFIRKTYKILEDDKNFDVISWNDEGTAIVIKNPTEFAQTILPTYFKHNNLNSFIRQLNMYDFHKKKTPDGEHVYYHELFQRGKKHLLKNIRRKNAESSVLNTEKSRLGIELAKSKQDIAAIVNENLFLKKVQSEAIVTINGLEEKVRELSAQNQALWTQLMKYNEKEEALRSLVPTFKRDIPLNPLSNIDINTSQFPGENIPNKIAQTTTRIPQFSSDMVNPRSWNFTPENFDGSNIPGFYNNVLNENTKQGDNQLNRKKGPKSAALKGTDYLQSDFASDLSQQIVKNMDQELQYLKKLTSSNKRPAAAPTNLSLSNSPDSSILGKRRIETDPGLPNFTSFENLSKIYKPDSYNNLNLLSNQCKAEGGREDHDEE